MKSTAIQAIESIKTYINSGPFSHWYTRIAKDPKDRLFNGHAVKENGDLWILVPCINSNEARNAEQYIVGTLGTKGDVGGGDDNSDCVYSYKITNHSRE